MIRKTVCVKFLFDLLLYLFIAQVVSDSTVSTVQDSDYDVADFGKDGHEKGAKIKLKVHSDHVFLASGEVNILGFGLRGDILAKGEIQDKLQNGISDHDGKKGEKDPDEYVMPVVINFPYFPDSPNKINIFYRVKRYPVNTFWPYFRMSRDEKVNISDDDVNYHCDKEKQQKVKAVEMFIVSAQTPQTVHYILLIYIPSFTRGILNRIDSILMVLSKIKMNDEPYLRIGKINILKEWFNYSKLLCLSFDIIHVATHFQLPN